VLRETGILPCESGTPTSGVPCDDYVENTTNDVGRIENNRIFCRDESLAVSPGPSK
jgi:hypothetical protein